MTKPYNRDDILVFTRYQYDHEVNEWQDKAFEAGYEAARQDYEAGEWEPRTT